MLPLRWRPALAALLLLASATAARADGAPPADLCAKVDCAATLQRAVPQAAATKKRCAVTPRRAASKRRKLAAKRCRSTRRLAARRLAAPTGLVVTGRATNSVSLDWNSYPNRCWYSVSVYSAAGAFLKSVRFDTSAGTVGSLQASTTYGFAARAVMCDGRATSESTRVSATTLAGSTSPSPTPVPTSPSPTPTPTDPAPSTSYLFQDEFSGPAGAPADPAKWIYHEENCDGNTDYACVKKSNTFQNGNGQLVVRLKRESSGWVSGAGPYSGGWISTFAYQTGWPPTSVKASYDLPYKIEMRAKMPDVNGAWGGGWDMNVDRSTSQNIYELDWAEQRMSAPTEGAAHQHTWLMGSDRGAWDCAVGGGIPNQRTNWTTYTMTARTTGVEYRINGQLCGTAPGVAGRFGTILNMGIGKPGSWGSGGLQPDPASPGPWDMLVDYVRVTRP